MMQKTASTKKESLFALLCLSAVLLSLTKIAVVTETMRDAMALCARSVVPSLFPFFVLTSCLLANPKVISLLSLLLRPLCALLGVSAEGGVAYLFGCLFGFPMGAKAVAEGTKSGKIRRDEGERLLLFCNNASPAFVIGGVGLGMLKSVETGVFLFFLQLLLSLLVGLVTRKKGVHFAPSAACVSPFSFSEAVRGACLQTLTVCGSILFFSVLSALCTLPVQDESLRALLRCVFEIGSGCGHAVNLPWSTALPLCAFALCFSGFSVYFQCKDVIRDTPLTMFFYLPVKLACGLAAALLCFLAQQA
ncbi:MAG: hypothetical protein J6R89_07175 [Clostridia bacterium]|nr:hypothetical protein [Clostridia bacterium]